jgi:hypothetical protein
MTQGEFRKMPAGRRPAGARALLLVLGLTAAGAAGCGAPPPPPAEKSAGGMDGSEIAAQADLKKNFVVRISNQSQVRDPVEIQVFLDERELLRERFPFAGSMTADGGSGHIEFKFELPAGKHNVRFRVPELDESADRDFEAGSSRVTAAFVFVYSVSQDADKKPVVHKQLDLQLRQD